MKTNGAWMPGNDFLFDHIGPVFIGQAAADIGNLQLTKSQNRLLEISLRWTVLSLRNKTTWSGFLWYLTIP